MSNPASSFSVLHHVVALGAPNCCAKAVDIRRVDPESSKRFGLFYHRIAHWSLNVSKGHSRFSFDTFMAGPWVGTDRLDRLAGPSLGIWEPHHGPGRDRRVTEGHNVRIALVFVPKMNPALPSVAGIASRLGSWALSRHLPVHTLTEVIQPLAVRASPYALPWRPAIRSLYKAGKGESNMPHQP